MRFIICFFLIISSISSISGQGIQDLYPTMPKDSLIIALKNNGFTLSKDDSKNRVVELQKITKEGILVVQTKFDSQLLAKNIQINYPKSSTWSKLKLQYDKINDSLKSEFGNPTKILSINTSKKGNELLDLKNDKIQLRTYYLDNFASVVINKNQFVQIQFENTIIDDKIKEEDVSIILGKTKEICVGRPISTFIDCSEAGGFTEDIDANFRVAILGTISCGEKKYYLIEINRNRIMVNARYIKIDKDLSFNEISRTTQNLNYKKAAETYSDDLNNNRKKEFKTYLDNQKTVGVILMNYSVEDVSEVTDGVTAKFEVFNPTNKTIKYVTFYVSGINAVGDKVYNSRQRSNISEFRGVGPIKSNETASYEWEYAWFTDVVETLKIIKVKIQYMDGSFKTVTTPNTIILPSKFQFQLQEHIDKL
ncbi:hypothetical protein [Aquirufa ecclesiirivi]|uniref:hypothetical protein n=1 Tax=Aquirufa ecclesiirivi TaxID=2715124 RepID=UPI003BB0C8E7